MAVKIFVWILSGAYFLTATVFSALLAKDVGPSDLLPYITMSYVSFLAICILCIGFLLYKRISQISGSVFRDTSGELILHIIFTVLFLSARIILDILLQAGLGDTAIANCTK